MADEFQEFRDEMRERLAELEMAREKKYAALLLAPVSRVSRGSKWARLMSVQGVLFAITFMMSTFETDNRCVVCALSLFYLSSPSSRRVPARPTPRSYSPHTGHTCAGT